MGSIRKSLLAPMTHSILHSDHFDSLVVYSSKNSFFLAISIIFLAFLGCFFLNNNVGRKHVISCIDNHCSPYSHISVTFCQYHFHCLLNRQERGKAWHRSTMEKHIEVQSVWRTAVAQWCVRHFITEFHCGNIIPDNSAKIHTIEFRSLNGCLHCNLKLADTKKKFWEFRLPPFFAKTLPLPDCINCPCNFAF